MTKSVQLVQKNFFQYESSRKHVDDMTPSTTGYDTQAKYPYEDTHPSAPAKPPRLFSGIETYKQRHPEQWGESEIDKVGPMVVWEAVALQLERLVEHLEH